jgi:hypothetical protein
MKKTQDDAQVKFEDGFVLSKNLIVVAAKLVSLADADYELTRIFTLRDGNWGQFDLRMTVRSLFGLTGPSSAMYCLARDGRVSVQRPLRLGGPTEERISDAGTGNNKLGFVSVIRKIGNDLFVCGVAGQIYRRESRGWAHFDNGVLDIESDLDALDLYCIDGSSDRDIYAVGEKGLLCHYNGKAWRRLHSPTASDLNWVKCVSVDEVYLCGNDGVFFRGRQEQWENFSAPEIGEEFWCVEAYRGRPYLAATPRLFEFDGRKVVPVKTELRPRPDGHRLHSNDGVLWSFGTDHLCFFDGKKWTYVKHPDNP